MKIKTIVEREDGTFEFVAFLTPAQHQFMLEFAIQEMIRRGLSIPFTADEISSVMVESTQVN